MSNTVTMSTAKISHRRTIITVAGVVMAHVVVLVGLANVKPSPLKKLEPPKPIEVKFVQLQPPKPQQQPKLEPKKPEPKPLPKPKEVPVVKEQPKTLPQHHKPKPVIATPVESARPQAVVSPQQETPPTTKADVPPPAPVNAEPPSPAPPAPPKLVQGVAYKNAPQIDPPTEDELGGQARKVVVKVLINELGRVDSIEITKSSGVASLDSAVKRAVKRATFYPYRENGVAMPVFTSIPIEFQQP